MKALGGLDNNHSLAGTISTLQDKYICVSCVELRESAWRFMKQSLTEGHYINTARQVYMCYPNVMYFMTVCEDA